MTTPMENPTTATEVGVFEAKTTLSQLIERVGRGESIVITRHGTPVARLVPCETAKDRERASEAVQELLGFERLKLPKGVTIKQLTEKGRS